MNSFADGKFSSLERAFSITMHAIISNPYSPVCYPVARFGFESADKIVNVGVEHVEKDKEGGVTSSESGGVSALGQRGHLPRFLRCRAYRLRLHYFRLRCHPAMPLRFSLPVFIGLGLARCKRPNAFSSTSSMWKMSCRSWSIIGSRRFL